MLSVKLSNVQRKVLIQQRQQRSIRHGQCSHKPVHLMSSYQRDKEISKGSSGPLDKGTSYDMLRRMRATDVM